MCVILIAETKRPTEEMVTKAYDHNSAGAGVAWRENGYVMWEKGIDLGRAQDLIAKVPLPFISHFRIPTEGGKRPSLCHPFPIERSAPLDLKGRTKGFVLFHNGHWSDWRKETFRIVKDFKVKLPEGKWSDTRAMAFAAAFYGPNIVEMLNEKAVVFGPGPQDLDAAGVGWSQVPEPGSGLWASNRLWEAKYPNYNSGMDIRPWCRERSCTSKELVGDTHFCVKHQPKEERSKVIVMPGDDPSKDSEEDSTGTNMVSADSRLAESLGGGSTESPFELKFALAKRLRNMGRLSKKKWKAAKKEHKEALKLYQAALKKTALGSMTLH